MKNSEFFRLVKGRLEQGLSASVCSAITSVYSNTATQYTQYCALKYWVRQLLGNHNFYETWLFEHHRNWMVAQGLQYVAMADSLCLPGRLQWVDWMITYWEAEEAKPAQEDLTALAG